MLSRLETREKILSGILNKALVLFYSLTLLDVHFLHFPNVGDSCPPITAALAPRD